MNGQGYVDKSILPVGVIPSVPVRCRIRAVCKRIYYSLRLLIGSQRVAVLAEVNFIAEITFVCHKKIYPPECLLSWSGVFTNGGG